MLAYQVYISTSQTDLRNVTCDFSHKNTWKNTSAIATSGYFSYFLNMPLNAVFNWLITGWLIEHEIPGSPTSTRPMSDELSSGKYFRYEDAVKRKWVGWYSVTSSITDCWSNSSARDINSGRSAASWVAADVSLHCLQPNFYNYTCICKKTHQFTTVCKNDVMISVL